MKTTMEVQKEFSVDAALASTSSEPLRLRDFLTGNFLSLLLNGFGKSLIYKQSPTVDLIG